jgi:hypothetical protein
MVERRAKERDEGPPIPRVRLGQKWLRAPCRGVGIGNISTEGRPIQLRADADMAAMAEPADSGDHSATGRNCGWHVDCYGGWAEARVAFTRDASGVIRPSKSRGILTPTCLARAWLNAGIQATSLHERGSHSLS